MPLSFPDDDQLDESLFQDDFDYEAWLKREFGEDGSTIQELIERDERFESLMGSVPANVLAMLFCLMFWGGMTIGIALMVAEGWKEFKAHMEEREVSERRERIRTVLEVPEEESSQPSSGEEGLAKSSVEKTDSK